MSRGFGFIVLRASGDSKLSIQVVDKHQTASADTKSLSEPRRYNYDEIVTDDLADPARKRGKDVAAAANGIWRVSLPSMSSTGPSRETSLDMSGDVYA